MNTGWIRLSELKEYYKTFKSNKSFREYIESYMQNLANDLWPDGHSLIGKNNKVIKTYYGIRKSN